MKFLHLQNVIIHITDSIEGESHQTCLWPWKWIKCGVQKREKSREEMMWFCLSGGSCVAEGIRGDNDMRISKGLLFASGLYARQHG